MADLVPSMFWRFPRWPSVWDDDEEWLAESGSSGLTVSEDEKNVYIEAAVPGLEPKDIEVNFHKGVLWIKGEAKEEEKKKKYYRRASRTFSYRVAVPGDVDPKSEPQAEVKNGVMTVTFVKSPQAQPKKITVKAK